MFRKFVTTRMMMMKRESKKEGIFFDKIWSWKFFEQRFKSCVTSCIISVKKSNFFNVQKSIPEFQIYSKNFHFFVSCPLYITPNLFPPSSLKCIQITKSFFHVSMPFHEYILWCLFYIACTVYIFLAISHTTYIFISIYEKLINHKCQFYTF